MIKINLKAYLLLSLSHFCLSINASDSDVSKLFFDCYLITLRHFELAPLCPQTNLKVQLETHEQFEPEDSSLKRSRRQMVYFTNIEQLPVGENTADIKYFKENLNLEKTLPLIPIYYEDKKPISICSEATIEEHSNNFIPYLCTFFTPPHRLVPLGKQPSVPSLPQKVELNFQIHEYLPLGLLKNNHKANRTINLQIILDPSTHAYHYKRNMTLGTYKDSPKTITVEPIEIE